MADAPDFAAAARAFLCRMNEDDGGSIFSADSDGERAWLAREVGLLAEQFRLVWNARGVADRYAIDAPGMSLGPFREKVLAAITKVDR